ncbi:nucleotidyltransferase domain-containing protein [Patescibacteria group bacterium]|nr:nucleotidyltransferase domain-containing protein [Patescibacteria group bacterium]
MNIQAIRKKILPTLKRHDIAKAALFGSAARGAMDKKSDVDLLVKFKKSKTLFDFVGLKLDLEKKLKRKVDILTYDYIYPPLKEIILGEQKIIYEQKKKTKKS